jgi:hypothetical protein
MATLRVFVSSTAYDLGMLRSALKTFIESLGFEPIMSEYSDVLYDPREHTHASCIAEVRNCDVMVLLIGARFGGEAIPSVVGALGEQDVRAIMSANTEHKFSVTQAESLTAFDCGMPVFSFVDIGVLHDYRVYSLNRDAKITYPSISQPEAAGYIFDFIDFLQNKSFGNAVIPFARMEDVITHLRKQWAALFQRLLRESRDQRDETRRIDRLSEQFDDLKTALLATVGDEEARRIARGVVRYRRLIDFIKEIPGEGDLRHYAINYTGEWREFLREYGGIQEIFTFEDERRIPPYICMIRADGSGFTSRMSPGAFSRLSQDWNNFKSEPASLRTVLYDTLTEQDVRPGLFMTRSLSKDEVGEFISRHMSSLEQNSGTSPAAESRIEAGTTLDSPPEKNTIKT